MNWKRKLTLLWCIVGSALLCWMLSTEANATTLTGTVKVNQTPFTGTMTFQLNYPATTGTYLTMPSVTAPISINNGGFVSLSLDGNDTLLPRGTYYRFNFYDPYGNMVTRLNYVITGSTYDLGSAVPTPIQTNNVNFLDLLGIRNFSALNATFTNQIQISTGTILSKVGISNAENIMGVLYAQAFNIQNPSSTTCGVMEAEAALPSTGGIIVLAPGTCNISTTITITKPGGIVGFGKGGYADSSTFTTYLAGSTLNNQGTGAAIILQPAAGQTLSGFYLHGFAITGQSGSGDAIQLGNSTQTTAFLKNVLVDSINLYGGAANGLNVVGNVQDLQVSQSNFNGNALSGMTITSQAGYAVDGVTLGPASFFQRNTVDGMKVDSPVTKTVRAINIHSTNNVNGVNFTSVSTLSVFQAYESEFGSNTGAGVLLAGGTGHVVESSALPANSIQQYGINLTSVGAAGSQTLSIKDDTFSSNLTADLNVGSTVPYVIFYPEVSQSTSTYTVNTWSVTGGTATLNVTGNTTISGGNTITAAGLTGGVGCTTLNGQHTAASATSTVITFSTTCTSGSGTSGSVAGGQMTVVQGSPGIIHYLLTNVSPSGIQFLILASQTGTSCTLAGPDADGNWSCRATFTWSPVLPISTSTYRTYCTLTYPSSGFNISDAAVATLMVISQTTTGFTYQIADHESGSNGAIYPMSCMATQ